MEKSCCLYCNKPFSEHIDEGDKISDELCGGIKILFKCQQSNKRPCDCEPDTPEPDPYDQYKSTQETSHVSKCKYYGYITIITCSEYDNITIIKNN